MLLVPNIRLDNKIDTRLRRIDCRPNPQSTVHCRKPTRCCISLTFRCLGHMSFQVQVHVFAYYEIIWICRCTLPPSQTAFTKKMKCGMQRKKTLPNLWSLSLATRYTAILGIFHFGSLFWFSNWAWWLWCCAAYIRFEKQLIWSQCVPCDSW